jgi:hypothetical protein
MRFIHVPLAAKSSPEKIGFDRNRNAFSSFCAKKNNKNKTKTKTQKKEKKPHKQTQTK